MIKNKTFMDAGCGDMLKIHPSGCYYNLVFHIVGRRTAFKLFFWSLDGAQAWQREADQNGFYLVTERKEDPYFDRPEILSYLEK